MVDTPAPALVTAARTRQQLARLCLAIAVAGFAFGVASVALVLTSDHSESRAVWAVFYPLVGWSFVGTGLFAWLRRPESRVGLLMVVVGFAWFLKAVRASDFPLLYTVGIPLATVYTAPFIHLLLSFPSGRLKSRFDRALVWTAYVDSALVIVPLLLVTNGSDARLDCPGDCPRNLLLVAENDTFGRVYVVAATAFGVVLLLIVCGLMVRRWRRATQPERRVLAPVLATGVLAFACIVIAAATRVWTVNWVAWIFLAAMPFAFLAGLLRARLARSAVADLMVELRATPAPADLRAALSRALGDPSLELAFWLPDYETYADIEGRRVSLADEPRRTTTVIERNGEPVAVLIHDPSLHEERALLDGVGAAAGIALENARLQTELRARLVELKGSRARVIEATDSERRRLERNLHDGAQQRLVAISLELGRLEERAESDPALKAAIERTKREAEASLTELRELARGIHPALVTDHGLAVALEALVARTLIPVELEVDVDPQLPEPVEVAAYYVVSECLANVAKYARASSANVCVEREDTRVVVEISDDGVGGADTDNGSGLRGLADRVEALDGRLRVWSPPGRGTRVRAEIPCA